MSTKIDHFMKSVARASKKNAERSAVQPKQVQQVGSSGVISTSAKITKTTTRMSDEEYKKWIIAAAIKHIINRRGTM